jgi:prevent-host-death family protein
MSVRAVEITEAVQSLGEYAQQISAGPVVVTKGGQPVAVVVSVENADMESISVSLNPDFMEIMDRSRARQEKEGGITSQEMRRRFGATS